MERLIQLHASVAYPPIPSFNQGHHTYDVIMESLHQSYKRPFGSFLVVQFIAAIELASEPDPSNKLTASARLPHQL